MSIRLEDADDGRTRTKHMTTRAFARWITWAMLGANGVVLVVNIAERQFALVALSTVVIALLASWLSICEALHGYLDAARNTMVMVNAVEDAVKRGHSGVDDRASVN